MPYYPITRVNISLQTSQVTRKGFGTPLFIGAHRWFNERVRSFSSLAEAAEVFPATSHEYKACLAAFKQNPAPSIVKVGRRRCTVSTTVSHTTGQSGVVYSFNITMRGGSPQPISYTTDADDTSAVVAAALATAANSILGISASDSGAVLYLSGDAASDDFAVSDFVNLSFGTSYTFAPLEAMATAYAAIVEEDNDFAITVLGQNATGGHDWTGSVKPLADIIEATDDKMFAIAVNEGYDAAYSVSSTDIGARIKQNNYSKTFAIYHHLGDGVDYPDMAIVAQNISYTPGEVTWKNNQINGFPASLQFDDSLPLTTTQKGYLLDRNMTFITPELGVDVTAGGKVGKGEWIDTIRVRDYWVARLKEANTTVFINQKGSKLGYNRKGLAQLHAACITVSDQLLSDDRKSRGLESYSFSFPAPEDITAEDRASGTVTVPFSGVLTGAITDAVFNGTLSFG